MVCPSRPYKFKLFKGCLPRILLGLFLNTSIHLFLHVQYWYPVCLLVIWRSCDGLYGLNLLLGKFYGKLIVFLPSFLLIALTFTDFGMLSHIITTVFFCCIASLYVTGPGPAWNRMSLFLIIGCCWKWQSFLFLSFFMFRQCTLFCVTWFFTWFGVHKSFLIS